MCGRTACTMAPVDVREACRYRNSNNEEIVPRYYNPRHHEYVPSYNVSPGRFTPVLLDWASCAQYECDGMPDEGRIVTPMRWGFHPPWNVKGGTRTIEPINCRVESLYEHKPMYRHALDRGQRCVVIADGFFEWVKTRTGKQPYFIHMRAPPNTGDSSIKSEPLTEIDSSLEVAARSQLMTHPPVFMAGMYEYALAEPNEADRTPTYAIITVPAASSIKWMHTRMPAVLPDKKSISAWLDPSASTDEVLATLRSYDHLEYYRVTPEMNNSQYDSPDAVLPLTTKNSDTLPRKRPSDGGQSSLDSFLKPKLSKC